MLDSYNKKRDFKKSPEPVGRKEKSKNQLRFCVQLHHASRIHYDFRLEIDGTLKSWAVPKCPSFDPNVKRLAILVEDHPLSYRDFEGVIPKDLYGGGTVMLWDEGTWEINSNPKEAFLKGNIKFTLNGKRLKGMWSLVCFQDNNWLLRKLKETDISHVDLTKYQTSIRTNRNMEEIQKEEC